MADTVLRDEERRAVEAHLATLMPDGKLEPGLKERIAGFSASEFDVREVAGAFAEDSKEEKKALLEIVASIGAADDEYDLAEDDFLMSVAEVLGLSGEDVAKYALDYEVETLRDTMAKLRPSPPPIPKG